MSDERVRAVMVRYYDEIWNQGRLEVCDELIAPDYVNHSAPLPGLPPGPGGVKAIVAAVRRAFPDLHYTIEDLVLGGEKAALRVTMRGTHRGEFFGAAPTGRTVEVQELQIEHLRDGQIVAHWHQIDGLSLQRQLGLLPHWYITSTFLSPGVLAHGRVRRQETRAVDDWQTRAPRVA